MCNDEEAIERLLDSAGERAALVIDQPGSIGTLAVAAGSRSRTSWPPSTAKPEEMLVVKAVVVSL